MIIMFALGGSSEWVIDSLHSTDDFNAAVGYNKPFEAKATTQ